MHDERRWATEGLARERRGLGLDVDLEIIEQVPRRRGLGPIEWTAIFIGNAIATGLIHSVVDDVYQRAKDMLRARRKAGKARELGFRIYGPKEKSCGSGLRRRTARRNPLRRASLNDTVRARGA
jgi:hypothetical protein